MTQTGAMAMPLRRAKGASGPVGQQQKNKRRKRGRVAHRTATRRQQWMNITMRIFVFCYVAVTALRDQIVILNLEDSELKRTANLNEETGLSRLVC
jgi:hypothetical protein